MQDYVEPRLSEREGRAHWLALFEELKRQRLLAPSPAASLARLAVLSALLAAALGAAWLGTGWPVLLAAHVALALLLAQFAFLGHDAGHGGAARGAAANRALGQCAMTLVTGLAYDEWIARHLAHHQHCQDEARDPDMQVALVVSLTESSLRTKGRVGRLLTRTQPAHVWPLTLFFGHSQRHLSQAAVLAAPHRRPLDAVMLVVHAALWFGLPCLLLEVSLREALVAYLVPATLLGPYLAAIFWVNHVGMPLVRDARRFSFLERQAVTSRTVLSPRAWDWLFGGLNFQIEHHLFPQVPARRLRAVHAVVRERFARHGLAYRGVCWRAAVRAVAAHFRRVARAA